MTGGAARRDDAEIHIVLVEPEIPPNTGSIGRLSLAAGARLHLVRPLGFSLDDRHLKRAGLDYWPHVDLHVHENWPDFLRTEQPPNPIFFSARAPRLYLDAPYAEPTPVHLVFGSESGGLPAELLAAHRSRTFSIPIRSPHVRSLNLANAVSIVVYEALRRRVGGQ